MGIETDQGHTGKFGEIGSRVAESFEDSRVPAATRPPKKSSFDKAMCLSFTAFLYPYNLAYQKTLGHKIIFDRNAFILSKAHDLKRQSCKTLSKDNLRIK